MSTKLTHIYPCCETPATCGWSTNGYFVPSLKNIYCEYPNCWCSRWFIIPNIQNESLAIGDKLEIIVYQGHSLYTSSRVLEYFKNVKNSNIFLDISGTNYKVQVLDVELIEAPEYRFRCCRVYIQINDAKGN